MESVSSVSEPSGGLLHALRRLRDPLLLAAVPVSFADSLEGAIERDAAIVGSPATVRAAVQRQLAATGANYFVGRFLFGTLPVERALRSVELFSREVMPAVPSRPSAP